MLFLSCDRESPVAAAMIRAFESHQFALRRPGFPLARGTGYLQGAFDCFGSAVGKKRAIQSGKTANLVGQFSLKFAIKKIGDMDQLCALLLYHPDHTRMCVAKGVDSNPANQVE